MVWILSPGLVVLAGAIVVSGWLVAVTVRFACRTEFLMEAMVQYAFLPEKRRRYMTFLSLEGCLFLLSALAWGLTSMRVIPPAIGDLLLPLLFLAGMTSIAALTWVGLRPTTLSSEDRAALRASGPAFLYSLAMAPLAERREDLPRTPP
jgi:hypothetical protein